MKIKWTDQYGLYDGSWKGLIVEQAFTHPAKFARGLICWIISHGLEKGYWHKGGEVVVTEEIQQQIMAEIDGLGCLSSSKAGNSPESLEQ